MGQVMVDLPCADLQLEQAMAAQVEHLLRFVDVLRGIAAGQCPGHRQRIAHAPAEQLADGQAQALAKGVEQGAFHAGFGKGVAAHTARHAQHGGVNVAGVLADQQRRDVTINVDLDAVGAFVAVTQAADGGGLTDALDAIAAAHSDDHQGLVLQGVHGQLVRANGWQIDDKGLDRGDDANRHGNTRWVAYKFRSILHPRFQGFQYRMGLA